VALTCRRGHTFSEDHDNSHSSPKESVSGELSDIAILLVIKAICDEFIATTSRYIERTSGSDSMFGFGFDSLTEVVVVRSHL